MYGSGGCCKEARTPSVGRYNAGGCPLLAVPKDSVACPECFGTEGKYGFWLAIVVLGAEFKPLASFEILLG